MHRTYLSHWFTATHGKNPAAQHQRNQRSQATKYGSPDFIVTNNKTLLWGTLKPKILATKTWKESRNLSKKGNLTLLLDTQQFSLVSLFKNIIEYANKSFQRPNLSFDDWKPLSEMWNCQPGGFTFIDFLFSTLFSRPCRMFKTYATTTKATIKQILESLLKLRSSRLIPTVVLR